MKGLCFEVGTKGAVFHIEGKQPVAGFYYMLEDATSGTLAQNKAFHSLLNAFYDWMFKMNKFQFEDSGAVYDLATPSQLDFREFFKYKYGEGYSHLEYVDSSFGMHRVKTFDEIPDYVIEDFRAGNQKRIKAVLKSWADYTKKQRQRAIDNLFILIAISGCDDKRVHEIMDGMKDNIETVKEVFGGEVIE